jgi:ABC-type transport system involved in multi-copper enzyme maturation permease subunit
MVMIIGTWLFFILRGAPPKELARILFYVLTAGAVLFALLSGPRSTADSISEEKREGTLGLLFLTDLKGYDVVLGKLVAGSLNSIYCIAAVLPMLAIPLLMGGGITLAEFVRMSLVALNALVFSLTLGICVSSVSNSAQKAAGVSALLILLIAVGLPGCGALIAGLTKAINVSPLFLAPSVGFSYYLAFDASYKSSSAWFWISMGIVQGSAWLCLILASLIAPRCWQDRAKGRTAISWREWWHTWNYGGADNRAGLRRRMLEVSPLLWLIARIRSKPVLVWIFLALLGAVWIWGWRSFKRDWLNTGVYLCTAAAMNLVLRCWFTAEATGLLAESRKSGALELLLSTPLKVEEILRGQWLALSRQFFGPVLAALAIECVFLLVTVRDAVGDEERLFWFSLWTAGMVMFIADTVALYWVGMWRGLTARNPLRASGGSLLRVLVVPWIGYCLAILLMVLDELTRHSYQPSPSWKFYLGLWFGFGIITDLAFGGWARQKLLTEFRQAAQQQYVSTSDFWKRWFGTLKPHVSGASPVTWDPETRP